MLLTSILPVNFITRLKAMWFVYGINFQFLSFYRITYVSIEKKKISEITWMNSFKKLEFIFKWVIQSQDSKIKILLSKPFPGMSHFHLLPYIQFFPMLLSLISILLNANVKQFYPFCYTCGRILYVCCFAFFNLFDHELHLVEIFYITTTICTYK